MTAKLLKSRQLILVATFALLLGFASRALALCACVERSESKAHDCCHHNSSPKPFQCHDDAAQSRQLSDSCKTLCELASPVNQNALLQAPTFRGSNYKYDHSRDLSLIANRLIEPSIYFPTLHSRLETKFIFSAVFEQSLFSRAPPTVFLF